MLTSLCPWGAGFPSLQPLVLRRRASALLLCLSPPVLRCRSLLRRQAVPRSVIALDRSVVPLGKRLHVTSMPQRVVGVGFQTPRSPGPFAPLTLVAVAWSVRVRLRAPPPLRGPTLRSRGRPASGACRSPVGFAAGPPLTLNVGPRDVLSNGTVPSFAFAACFALLTEHAFALCSRHHVAVRPFFILPRSQSSGFGDFFSFGFRLRSSAAARFSVSRQSYGLSSLWCGLWFLLANVFT